MDKSIRALRSLNNNSILMHDELVSLKNAIKDGLRDVVEANKKLDPAHEEKSNEVGAWRKVEPYSESKMRPLVQSDVEQAMKKLDII